MRFIVIRHNLRPSYPPNPLRHTLFFFTSCQALPLQAPEPGPVQCGVFCFFEDCNFVVSTNCIGLWEGSNASLRRIRPTRDWRSIKGALSKLNQPYARSRLHAHSKSTCTGSGFICVWFKKTSTD
jgi:hypothetical protein